MTLNYPVDGFGIYDNTAPSLGSSVYQPILSSIAAGGFKLVLNYDLLFGHTSDMIAYINYAASVGLKVIVALHNSVIWDTTTYPTSSALASEYVSMYADAGSPTSNWDQTFSQYVVNQVKSLAGVWGYYVADEATATQHSLVFNHAGYIHSADATHPRLLIAQGDVSANTFANGTTSFYDCCDVGGDDYYPIGNASYTLTTAQQASGIQSYCNSKSIQSAMVLQAHSYSEYGTVGAPFPTEAQMQQMRNDALSNMTPRLLLWYSYFDATSSSAPSLQWTFLQDAIAGKSSVVLFPSATRRGARR